METLYVIRDNNTFMKEAYISKDRAIEECDNLNFITNGNFKVYEMQLPFIGRSVCTVSIYRGFNYDFLGGKIFDVHEVDVRVYACMKLLKEESAYWAKYEEIANMDPNNYIFSDTMIASKAYSLSDDHPFIDGDIIEGKFNMQIKRIRVLRN